MAKRSPAALAILFGSLAVSEPAHATCREAGADGQPQQTCEDPVVKPPEVAPIVPTGTPPIVPPAIAPTMPPMVPPHGTTSCGPGQVPAGSDTVTRPVCR